MWRFLYLAPVAILFMACVIEGQTGSIYLTNEAQYDVVGVYYAEAGTNAWSDNLLSEPIQPGQSRVVEGIPREVVDIKIVFGDPSGTTNITQRDFAIVNRLNIIVAIS